MRCAPQTLRSLQYSIQSSPLRREGLAAEKPYPKIRPSDSFRSRNRLDTRKHCFAGKYSRRVLSSIYITCIAGVRSSGSRNLSGGGGGLGAMTRETCGVVWWYNFNRGRGGPLEPLLAQIILRKVTSRKID